MRMPNFEQRMIHKTKGIVLRTIKYGETSLVATIFTELFGVQTYMINGVRSSAKKQGRAGLLQPSSQLDLIVYHSENKPMQRIKEFSWSFIYQDIMSHVIKNGIALYMTELLHKCLKQPEPNADLFHFCEASLQQLDKADRNVTANFPLFFTLQLAHFFGFRMTDNYNADTPILDLQEGCFTDQLPVHPHFIDGQDAMISSALLKVMQPAELAEATGEFQLTQEVRRRLLMKYLQFYALHIPEFGQVKTLAVLHEVL